MGFWGFYRNPLLNPEETHQFTVYIYEVAIGLNSLRIFTFAIVTSCSNIKRISFADIIIDIIDLNCKYEFAKPRHSLDA